MIYVYGHLYVQCIYAYRYSLNPQIQNSPSASPSAFRHCRIIKNPLPPWSWPREILKTPQNIVQPKSVKINSSKKKVHLGTTISQSLTHNQPPKKHSKTNRFFTSTSFGSPSDALLGIGHGHLPRGVDLRHGLAESREVQREEATGLLEARWEDGKSSKSWING